jgi:TonB family protein
MPVGTQRYERTKMVLPLRVWTDQHPGDVTALQLAHTIDISPIGGRLGGLRTELSPGQTIMLQRGDNKAPFRVIWSKHLATHEHQAGIEALESGDIWGIELPQAPSTRNSAGRSAMNGNFTATLAVQPFASSPRTSPRAPRASRSLTPAVIPRRVLWGLSLALFLLSGLLTLSLYQDIFDGSDRVAIRIPVPGPPTAEDLARLTPTPQQAHPIVVQRISLVPRVQVAEAPTGRIVYPVSPDDGIGGKVRLQVIIAASGLVEQVHVLSGRSVLAQAAKRAVRLWHYGPFLSDGLPAERETSVVVSFRGTDAVSLQFPSSNRSAQIRAN